MEQHGGPAAPPRPPKATWTARVHAGPAARAPVTLARPRPEAERGHNAYVETPQRGARVAPPPCKPITAQPEKRPQAAAECARDSIVCEECGRCRCEQCSRPRPLPSRWLCDFCLCSAEAAVDYASCMCCVKALFYHCGGDEDASCADEPCGCGGRRRAARWGCVAALSLALPCLCLYWPLRACASFGQRLYAGASKAGCRCPPDKLLPRREC